MSKGSPIRGTKGKREDSEVFGRTQSPCAQRAQRAQNTMNYKIKVLQN